MKTINIKGRLYVPVSERIKEFHDCMSTTGTELFAITTEIISSTDKMVTVKATVNNDGNVFTGQN